MEEKQFSLSGIIKDLERRIKQEEDPAERERLKGRLRAARRVEAHILASEGTIEKAVKERAAR